MIEKKGNVNEGNLDLIELFIKHLKKEHSYSDDNIKEFLTQKKSEYLLPVTLFSIKGISAFEAIVKYLKENHSLSFKRIAELTNRNYTSVYTTYNKANGKHKSKLKLEQTEILVPLSILKERNLSVLESIVHYLKERYDLTFAKIGVLLDRDDRTIWTVNNRAQKKLGSRKDG